MKSIKNSLLAFAGVLDAKTADKMLADIKNNRISATDSCSFSLSFSSAAMEIAKYELEKFEKQSDEDFLARAKLDRKLSSL